MRRLLVIVFMLLPLAAVAQEEGGGIDIIDVSGPLDASALEFVDSSIRSAGSAGQELVIVQVNSRAALDFEALEALMLTVERPPVPVALWVGPAPAEALGGAAQLVLNADQAAIAPGSEMGMIEPTIAGEDHGTLTDPGLVADFGEIVPAEETGLELQPTIRQYIQDLDGRTFSTADGPVEVETIQEFTQDGQTGVTTKPVTFIKPGLGIRFFRLAVTPEAAFFFLVAGLSIVSFEFFAIGPGVAAAFGSLSLLLAGWGVVNLPTNWWALALAVAGWVLLTVAYQRGGVIVLTGVGAFLLQVGGSFFIDGSGQIDPRWWLVLPSTLSALFFFLLAMPTVQRARFSTQVLGREGMIASTGVALSDFDPDGLVEVRGARWRATAHRESGITEGDGVVVIDVDGLYLEVEPDGREN